MWISVNPQQFDTNDTYPDDMENVLVAIDDGCSYPEIVIAHRSGDNWYGDNINPVVYAWCPIIDPPRPPSQKERKSIGQQG